MLPPEPSAPGAPGTPDSPKRGLAAAVGAAEFVPHRQRAGHCEALHEFRAHTAYYQEVVCPALEAAAALRTRMEAQLDAPRDRTPVRPAAGRDSL